MATGSVMRNPDDAGTYSYSSQPHTVRQRTKYRDEDMKPANIMYDKRVVRGNTYAITSLPANTQKPPTKLQQQQHQQREASTQRRMRHHMRQITPPAVDGRRHTEVQTELYLEEITDRVEEADIHTQTDAFLDRPPTPLFIPAKTGIDAATQIEEGDLFDFDLEVKPILEVLVGKTVEQALLEVMEEEELSILREQQREFEENRNAELVETQRLEEQERRRREEKDRRKDQQRKALIKEKETAEKIAARAFAQSYLADLVPAVFTTLVDHGFFYDRVERDVEIDVMPWLMAETKKIMDKRVVARLLLDAMIRSVVKKKLGIVTPQPSPPPTAEDTTVLPTTSETKEGEEAIAEKDETKTEPSAETDTAPSTEQTTEQKAEGESEKKDDGESKELEKKDDGESKEGGESEKKDDGESKEEGETEKKEELEKKEDGESEKKEQEGDDAKPSEEGATESDDKVPETEKEPAPVSEEKKEEEIKAEEDKKDEEGSGEGNDQTAAAEETPKAAEPPAQPPADDAVPTDTSQAADQPPSD